MTGTYLKTLYYNNIPTECQLLWNRSDMLKCKRNEFEDVCNDHEWKEPDVEQYRDTYKDVPELDVVSFSMDSEYLKGLEMDAEFGFDMRKLFALSTDKTAFINDAHVHRMMELFYTPNKKTCIHDRLKKRGILSKHAQLWFLPYGSDCKVSDVGRAMINMLCNNKSIADLYDVCLVSADLCINSSGNEISVPNKVEFVDLTYRSTQKNLIILTGSVFSLGVSFPFVDAVMFLDNCKSHDLVYQRMMRCLTSDSSRNKKTGFVIDFNLNRVLHTCIDYILPEDSERTIDSSLRLLPDFVHLDLDFHSFKSSEELYAVLNASWMSYKYSNIKSYISQLPNIALTWFKMTGGKHTIKTGKEKMPSGIICEKITVDETGEQNKKDKSAPPTITLRDLLQNVLPFVALETLDSTRGFRASLDIMDTEAFEEFCVDCFGRKYQYMNYFKQLNIDLNNSVITTMDLIIGQIRQKTNEVLAHGDPIASLTHLMDIITPSTNFVKEHGEVFTPMDLVNEILDKLPEHVWNDKNFKWLEPAAGMGNFMVCVYDRLMKGLERCIPDKGQRKEHILKQMLWMVELNPKNVRMTRLIFGTEINLVEGDFLTWNPDIGYAGATPLKFDVILGNPPFQESSKSGDNKSVTLLQINGLLSLITPTKALDYLLITGKNREIFDKLYNILHISLNTVDKYFKVNSTFMYFILTNSDYTGPTTIMYVNKESSLNSASIQLSKGFHLPKSLDAIDLDILRKITDDTDIFEFNEFKFGKKTQRIRKHH